ncbi:LuxR C-terminal-related transcriptional regulator [Actinoplanes hulinensis]|uniref:LuxR C-terminal-related transcriptional regulator n=1 Tax=Actinoplanes hulinensis TaxID=1144547 RepID=A0ABS7B421_9ACTN|nr:LuxR C-terminal-related transcriptional regulator [Actinoplanes hulinensis]MBW6435778.1 LuxR C-terminal-related transcriptional regulator [Actinoplanes hulinensis]
MIGDHSGELPLDLSPFVGRDDLLAAVTERLRRTRLLTLTGPAGVGKSRLALRAAVRLGRVRYADLATGTPLWAHLAAALGIPDHDTAHPDAIFAHLAGLPTVLILDSCDRIPGAADATTALLRAAPGLRILATGRRRLGIDGEYALPVPPLGLPDAVRLFLDLAEAGGVAATALTDRAAVERLCTELDGLPLAIKLAAARARTMSLTELTERAADRFTLLPGLRTAVDLSYRQCSPQERQLWTTCAVFAAPFTAAAAPGDLDGLVDKSVLTAATDTHPARFTMLRTLRAYGLEQLGDRAGAARDRHRDHYRAFLAGAADGWFGPQELAVLTTVRDELPDILAAVEHDGTHTLTRDLVRTRAPFVFGFPGVVPLADAWDILSADRHTGPLIAAIGAAFTGDPNAPTLAADCLHRAETAGSPIALTWALWAAALARHRAGDQNTAAGLLTMCLDRQRSFDDRWGQAWSIELAAWIIAARCDDTDEAGRAAWLLGAATARHRELGVDLTGIRQLDDARTRARNRIETLLGADTTAAETAAGEQGHDHAIRIALGEPVSRRASAPPGGGLTTREQEIAGLVAEGLTSARIGARLRISARTVDTHIRNIGAKLGLANRAAIAAWASSR